jgi:FkbM family methyltransferase
VAISYTQNLEDYHLSLAFAGEEQGFYLDIGAGHPIADNVTFWFYERGWSGIVVEPQTRLASMYAHVRSRDVCVSCLVGREVGEADFFQFRRLHGLSTMVRTFADSATKFGADYEISRVPVTTLKQLCAQHGVDQIDFLKIDVEGAEGDVLAGNDWRRYRPKVIVAEAVALEDGRSTWESWEPALLAEGYEFTLFDTLNRFYVAKEQSQILARMPRVRAPWNSATHLYEIGKAPENPLHPDHQLANDLVKAFWALLPTLDATSIATLIAHARDLPDGAQAPLMAEVQTERFKAALGRIACSYDGGQVASDGG